MSLLKKADRLPPCICRLIARKDNGRNGMTHADIAKVSGLSLSTVKDYSFRTTWANRPVGSADAFAEACGVDLMDVERHTEFLRRRQWVHVFKAKSPKQRAMYASLLKLHPEK
jgi:hypothetical protein